MPKQSQKSRRRVRNSPVNRPRGRRQTQASGLIVPGRTNMSVPRAIQQSHMLRRCFSQDLTYAPTTGFFLSGPNIQLNFSASACEVRLGGVLVFSPIIPNSSEFANLFDQWRIKNVTVRLDWNFNAVGPADHQLAAPLVYYVTDYDDSQDASVAALLQYPAVQTHSFMTNGYTPVIYSFIPKPLKDIAGTGLLTTYGPDLSMPFIRTAELTTPHYGMKIATYPMGGTSSSVQGLLRITGYVDFEFANPK